MLDKPEESAARVDERLVKAVRIIVDQYDGDVQAFIEAIRCRMDVTREDETKPINRGEAALQRL